MRLTELPDLVLDLVLYHVAVEHPPTFLLKLPRTCRSIQQRIEDLPNIWYFRVVSQRYDLGEVDFSQSKTRGNTATVNTNVILSETLRRVQELSISTTKEISAEHAYKIPQSLLQSYVSTVQELNDPTYYWTLPASSSGTRPNEQLRLWKCGVAYFASQFGDLHSNQFHTKTDFKSLYKELHFLTALGEFLNGFGVSVSESDNCYFLPVLLSSINPKSGQEVLESPDAFFKSINSYQYLLHRHAFKFRSLQTSQLHQLLTFDEEVEEESRRANKAEKMIRRWFGEEWHHFYITDGFMNPMIAFFVGKGKFQEGHIGGLVTGIVWT